jgi:putative N6-adenine-specific DNA methylase
VRENLAAGILRALDWAPGEALVDPMCGSGTFPIEAATIATGRSPGIARDFAFERWPNFDAKTWNAIVTEAKAMPSLDNTAPIVAGDRDPGAITATRENAQRAGVATRIQVRPGTFMDMRPPAETGLVVMNPPYGQRVAPGQVADIYKSIGRTLRTHWSGWRYGILMPSKPLASALGLAGEDVLQFSNGGIDVWLRAGEVL